MGGPLSGPHFVKQNIYWPEANAFCQVFVLKTWLPLYTGARVYRYAHLLVKKVEQKHFPTENMRGKPGPSAPFPPAPPSYTSFKAGVASAPGGECVAQRSRGGRAPYIYEGTEGTRI